MNKVGVYFQSWSSAWSSKDLDLLHVTSDIIYLAFVHPNCGFVAGQNSFAGTGLDFSSEFSVVKAAIVALQSQGKKVMLSVGGASYGFAKVNIDGIMNLKKALGCDGIDIDWEPINNDPSEFTRLIQQFKNANPGYLSAAVFSVGAYGAGKWKNSKPQGNYNALNRTGLLDAGHLLDWINIMAYDAGPEFDPTEAFDAYADIYKGKIYLGLEVGQQAWGGALLTSEQVLKWSRYAFEHGGGIFGWSWQKSGSPDFKDILKIVQPLLGATPPIPIPPVDLPEEDDPFDEEPLDCHCICHRIPTPPVLPPVPPVVPPNSPTSTAEGTWEPWTQYKPGDVVTFVGQKYTCRQPHTSQPDWYPSVVPALWK